MKENKSPDERKSSKGSRNKSKSVTQSKGENSSVMKKKELKK